MDYGTGINGFKVDDERAMTRKILGERKKKSKVGPAQFIRDQAEIMYSLLCAAT